MNRTCLIFCVVLLLGLSPAQSAYGFDLYALASYWEIEDADGVWGAGVGVSLPLMTESVRLDSRAYFFENSDLDGDDDLELLPIDVGLQIHFLADEPLDPYLVGGVSWIEADADRIDVDSDLGGYAGGGLEWGMTDNLHLFGEAVYRFAELDTDSAFEDEVEISGITVNTGLKFHF